MSLSSEFYGSMPDGREIRRFLLKTPDGMEVSVITYGARITEIRVPDRNGDLNDVVMGYDTLEEYRTPRDSQGAIIGRYAGRISGARMTLNGQEYQLANNANGNTLHGGTGTGACFSEKVWDVAEASDTDEPSLKLHLISPDMDGGFPGNLDVQVTYCLHPDHALEIRYAAVCDRDTVLNLTSHCFFNLNGYNGKNIHSQHLTIQSDSYTETAEADVVTGRIRGVAGTALDFRQGKRMGDGIDVFDAGYNHNFVLNSTANADIPAAVLYDPETGRQMEVFTDQPGLQVYTAGGVKNGKPGKKGTSMRPFCAVCLETQHFPDSVHYENFPTTVLKAGETWRSITTYRFSVR